MFQRLLVRPVRFGGELAGALVELRGHLGGFLRRTAERNEDLGKLGNFHKFFRQNYKIIQNKKWTFPILTIL